MLLKVGLSTSAGCMAFLATNEPPRGKTNIVVSDQVDTNSTAQKTARSMNFRI